MNFLEFHENSNEACFFRVLAKKTPTCVWNWNKFGHVGFF